MTDEEFTRWKAVRDKAVAGTFDEFKIYAAKMGQMPKRIEVLEIMYHKCRTGITNLPKEMRQASHEWLIAHNYSSWI